MAGPITTPTAAKMAESVRAVFNVNAKAMQMLPADGAPFSVRQWVRGEGEAGSLLFLSARYVDMSVLSQLLTLWLDTAINTLMTGRRTRDVKLCFLIDELGALHRLPSLEKGLQTARNFGGAIVTGVHAFAKLKDVYGENMAMTLSSLSRTKLILATSDRETATWCSDVIGHREVREMEEGYSYGYNNARDAVSLTPRRQVVPLLLPDEFMELPSLSGFIKFPDGFPAAPVTLVPRKWPRVAEGFIARDLDPPLPGRKQPAGHPAGAMTGADQRDDGHHYDGDHNAKHGDESSDEGSDPRRLAGKRQAPADRQKARASGKQVSPKPNERQPKDGTKDRHKIILEDQAQVDGKADRNAASAGKKEGAAQRELPLGEAKAEPSNSGRSSRTDIPDPQAVTEAAKGRNQAEQRQHEEQQRALLGGASKPDQAHDIGNVEPDI
jgi:hypothetical protein